MKKFKIKFKLKTITKPVTAFLRLHENKFKIPTIAIGAGVLGYSAAGLLQTMFIIPAGIVLQPLELIFVSCLITSVVAVYASGDITFAKEKENKWGKI